MTTSILLIITSCLLIWQSHSNIKLTNQMIDNLKENMKLRKKYMEMLKIISNSKTIEEIASKVVLSIQYHSEEPVESSHE
jgi:hypothetical protein